MDDLPIRHTQKVLAYITHGDSLLVFSHVTEPEAGIQVPGGTIEEGEQAEVAIMREAAEETGLSDLTFVRRLGQADYDMSEYGRNELQHRTVFHLHAPQAGPRRWTHWETSGGKGRPKLFELFWVRLPDQVPELIAGHGDFIRELKAGELK